MFTAHYLRVSRADLTVENQAQELTAAGFEASATFVDEGVSGKTRAIERPGFREMMTTFARLNGSTRKRIVCTKVDRLGRDAEDILATVRTLAEIGVAVFVKQLGETDLTSPTGKLILTVLGAVAEMERALIIERTQAGLDRAKAEGKQLGRPDALTVAQQQEARSALAEGAPIAALARRYNVARGTIRKLRTA